MPELKSVFATAPDVIPLESGVALQQAILPKTDFFVIQAPNLLDNYQTIGFHTRPF